MTEHIVSNKAYLFKAFYEWLCDMELGAVISYVKGRDYVNIKHDEVNYYLHRQLLNEPEWVKIDPFAVKFETKDRLEEYVDFDNVVSLFSDDFKYGIVWSADGSSIVGNREPLRKATELKLVVK